MFGKILVVLHVAMSLCLATWAGMVYFNRPDWAPPRPESAMPGATGPRATSVGEVAARKAAHETVAVAGLRPAHERVRRNRADLEDHESWRPRERAWYTQQIAFLTAGATEDNPVRQVDRAPDGNPIVLANPAPGADLLQMGDIKDDKGQPLNGRDGQPLVLKGFDYYNTEFDRVVSEETEALKQRQLWIKADRDATDLLIGPWGLQANLLREEEKQEKIKGLREDVHPVYLNTRVELQNLQELQQRLEKRGKELGIDAGGRN